MVVEHNSRNNLYRSPFGAVPCLSEVTLRLFGKSDEIPSSVSLVCHFRDEEPVAIPMYFCQSVGTGSIYEAKITVPDTPGLIWYYFVLKNNGHTIYYGNNLEQLGGIGETFKKIPPCFQITVYKEDYKTPDWFKEGIAYQIFPDRFAKGDMDSFEAARESGRNDIIPRQWNDIPYYKKEQFGEEYLANDFYGGNLDGIIKKLPYLADLGISVIYLNPIFKAYSNHKYDTGDYNEVDPMFGDNELFEKMCKEAKKYGIRIILDGVFNHTGSDSKYFNKDKNYSTIGAFQSKDSPYYPWYDFIDYPNVYQSWWGFQTLPNVNEMEPSFVDYILESPDAIMKKWLKLGASGWRLDVADELPEEFIKIMRKEVKSEDPDAILIGEVWEDASNKVSYGQHRDYLLGDELDSVMNYPLRNAIKDFTCEHVDAANFTRRLMSLCENYPKQALYSMMNFLSTHDSMRILTILGDAPSLHLSKDEQSTFKLDDYKRHLAKRRLENATLLQLTLPGVPCIYYGDEVGMEGFDDPFNRATYPWGNEDTEVLDMYKKMISLRQDYHLFVDGDIEVMYAYGSTLAFARFNCEELMIVSVNMSSTEYGFTRLDLARFKPESAVDIYTDEDIELVNGIIIYDLPPLSYRVIEIELGDDACFYK